MVGSTCSTVVHLDADTTLTWPVALSASPAKWNFYRWGKAEASALGIRVGCKFIPPKVTLFQFSDA